MDDSPLNAYNCIFINFLVVDFVSSMLVGQSPLKRTPNSYSLFEIKYLNYLRPITSKLSWSPFVCLHFNRSPIILPLYSSTLLQHCLPHCSLRLCHIGFRMCSKQKLYKIQCHTLPKIGLIKEYYIIVNFLYQRSKLTIL